MANFKVKGRRRVPLPGRRLTVFEWLGRIAGFCIFMLASALAIGILLLAILYCYHLINVFIQGIRA